MNRLESEFARRGIACHTGSGADTSTLEFVETSDTLYLTIDAGVVRRAELNPDFRARPTLHDRIYDILEALGYEHVDEDDPRIVGE